MKRDVKSPPIDRLVDRYFSRSRLHGLPDAQSHLLYLGDEDALYRYVDGAYAALDERIAFPSELVAFFQEERDPAYFTPSANDDEETVDGFLPLHPNTNISPDLIRNVQKMIPWRVPSQRRIDSQSSPYITFNDLKVVDLADPLLPLIPASPDVPSFLKVDFASSVLGGEAQTTIQLLAPRFLRFLDEILVEPFDPTATHQLPHDPMTLTVLHAEGYQPSEELQNYMQEIFGYCLLDGITSHAAFFFYGEGQNGKSKLLATLRSLFPPDTISYLRISDFANDYKVSMLIGKRLNIANEEESKNIKIDVLKNLISGEPMPANRKYRDAISFTPRAKFLFSTNDLPTFEKIDFALRRRLHIIPFRRIIPDHLKDPDLETTLLKERAGILRWAVEGARRFIARGRKFNTPTQVTRLFDDMVTDRFPALRFFHAFYETTNSSEDAVESQTMYAQYREWCQTNGYTALNEANFGKQILSIDKRIQNTRVTRKGNTERHYARTNIRRKPNTPTLIVPS